MRWLRFAIVDLIVTACILLATFGGQVWAAWAVWIYTPFILLLRFGALGTKAPKQKSTVPEAFYHVLFAVNVAVPLFHAWRVSDTNWYWVGAAWIIIWVLSAIAAFRQRPAK